MRIRRLTALFWTSCFFVFLFILYVVTDLSQKLPNIRPGNQEIESKWTSFQSKLRHLEYELQKHNEVVGEIRSAVDRMVDQSKEYHPPQKRPKAAEVKQINNVEERLKYREFNEVVREEPPRQRVTVKFDESECPFRNDTPKSDIQMLSLYERMKFDDIDGGVWKQGWNIEYDQNQWSSKNKLKVFIVPHSHNDPGWLKTFEEYYKTQTKAIFNNMVEKLQEGYDRKFIWAETSFLSLWWNNDASEISKASFKKLLDSGLIEIVTGGWVMNDEANSHWLSVVQQLTTGHQWLLDNLGYIPRNAWSIDPFGHSSSQPYLLKLAGFENSVIQRVHYRVKKELAVNKQLEFKWRQYWDSVGETDIFTHMMPFYSYDVPHSCGPDPKICCQFDFRRLPGSGVTCPWNKAPVKITPKNVVERAYLILDQWRKKAQLYRSNVVLFPLGDDFRYDTAMEWKSQYENYETLKNYINNNDQLNADVNFGTLQDYFKAVHEETKLSDFPVLSGDFFTYADRQQHYWSGYYTSRPFYKSMDRVLLGYVRAAEIITSQAMLSGVVTRILSIQLRDRTEHARRALALFQHHDGVTGTSKDLVRKDYAMKMLEAIKYCQSAIQQAAYYLLKKPEIAEHIQDDVYFDVDDIWRTHDELPTRLTIALDAVSRSRRLVLYNALVFKRTEIVTVFVSSPHVEVFDPEGSPVMAQISPVVTGEKHFTFAANKFQLSFPVTVEHLSLAVYTVSLREAEAINKHTSYARVRIYNADYMNVDLPKMFAIEKPTARLDDDLDFQAGDTRVVVNKDGMIKAVVSNGVTTPVHMDYVKYGTLDERDNRSGAYLFIPDGPAQVVKTEAYPELIVTEGPHQAALHAALHGMKAADILLSISVRNNPSLPQRQVEVSNTLVVDAETLDVEVALRFSSNIDNGDVFYTDLNGMQMIKRRYMEKIPLQANFYPLPAAVYIEDAKTRMTVLTSSPLGVAALRPGQIEIMQDRRLGQDDNRGLNQGVTDNVRTRHTFQLILESGPNCPHSAASGQLTLGAHIAQQMVLQPVVVMHYTAPEGAPRPSPEQARAPPGADVVLATFQSHVSAKDKSNKIVHGMGMTFQRVHLDTCYGEKSAEKWYPIGNGQVQIAELTGVPATTVLESSLTWTRARSPLPAGALPLCRARIRSVFLNHTLHLL